jgi:hypothetical protein
MAKPTVFASSASFLGILGPVELLALALFAEVASKGSDFKKAQERKEFTDSVLHRRSR